MATLALTYIGGAIGGPIGAAVGSALGGFILDPLLFYRGRDQKGPKLGELNFQGADEGDPIAWSLGPECKHAGNIIWKGPRIRIENRDQAGGSGAGKQTAITYTDLVDVAILVCEVDPTEPIVGFDEVWAGPHLIYDATPDIEITSDELEVIRVDRVAGFGEIVGYWMDVRARVSGTAPNLTTLKTGTDTTITGFARGANNGTFRCVSTRTDGDGNTYARFQNTDCVDEAAGAEATLFQDLPEFQAKNFESISFYTGAADQLPDPLMESYLGAGNVPAYNGYAYVVIERFNLTNYGVLPTFRIKYAANAAPYQVASAIEKVIKRSGRFTADDYDLSELDPTKLIRGMTVLGPQPLVEQLAPLMLRHNVVAPQDVSGRLRFFHREDARVVQVPNAYLAAREAGDALPDVPCSIDDPPTRQLPTQVTLSYINATNDYQTGTEVKRLQNGGAKHNVKNIELPLVEDPSVAQDLAARILYTTWADRRFAMQLPPRFLNLAAGDVVELDCEDDVGQTYRAFLETVDLGENYLVQAVGVQDVPSTYAYEDSLGLDGSGGEGEVRPPPELRLEVVDVTALQSSDLGELTVYFWLSPYTVTDEFFGGLIFESLDGGTTFSLLTSSSLAARLGDCLTVLPSASPYYVDVVSTLDVRVDRGSLTSYTTTELLNGKGRYLVGNELIAARDATLIDEQTWRLSYMLRGLRNTESEIGAHVAGERFISLNDPGGVPYRYNPSALGTTRVYKAVPVGGDPDQYEADLDAHTGVLRGRNLYPFPPTRVHGTRDGSNDLTVTAVRRSRAFVRPLFQPVPLLEAFERYEVDVYEDDTFATVVRTIPITGDPTFTYTAAQQTSDGLTPGDPVALRWYMLSDVVGRGRAQEAVV